MANTAQEQKCFEKKSSWQFSEKTIAWPITANKQKFYWISWGIIFIFFIEVFYFSHYIFSNFNFSFEYFFSAGGFRTGYFTFWLCVMIRKRAAENNVILAFRWKFIFHQMRYCDKKMQWIKFCSYFSYPSL